MIVEDDLMLADMLEEILMDAGYKVCCLAPTVDIALESAIKYNPDLYTLDLRLAEGGYGTEVAAQIDRSSNPGILYVTGNSSLFALTQANGHACLNKPYTSKAILTAVQIVFDIVANMPPSLPFPIGFHILPIC
jgi:DNA-binding response OmpR family regulator